MDIKHTPLPWFTSKHTVDGITNYDVMAEDGDEDPWFVAMAMQHTQPDGSGEANAAFIVLACNSYYDLLDALKDARFALYGNGPGNPKIDAAIAKAEGR